MKIIIIIIIIIITYQCMYSGRRKINMLILIHILLMYRQIILLSYFAAVS
jgi:hypothetical protein